MIFQTTTTTTTRVFVIYQYTSKNRGKMVYLKYRSIHHCFLYCQSIIIIICMLLLSATVFSISYNQDRNNGRYSYSLTTFDPSGKLGQVERAIEAAQRGPPIIVMIYNNTNISNYEYINQDDGHPNPQYYGVIMIAPQILPIQNNKLILDDGTTRFLLLTSTIMISHSGLTSDGRYILQMAQKIAIQHEYTYNEPISIHILLEELSLLYQEYTGMKVGTRPFGTSLLIVHVPTTVSNTLNDNQPSIYRIDPSGIVEELLVDEQCTIVHGNTILQDSTIRNNLLSNLQSLYNNNNDHSNMTTTIDEFMKRSVQFLRDALQQQNEKNGNDNNDNINSNNVHEDVTILSATLSSSSSSSSSLMFRKERHTALPVVIADEQEIAADCSSP